MDLEDESRTVVYSGPVFRVMQDSKWVDLTGFLLDNYCMFASAPTPTKQTCLFEFSHFNPGAEGVQWTGETAHCLTCTKLFFLVN